VWLAVPILTLSSVFGGGGGSAAATILCVVLFWDECKI